MNKSHVKGRRRRGNKDRSAAAEQTLIIDSLIIQFYNWELLHGSLESCIEKQGIIMYEFNWWTETFSLYNLKNQKTKIKKKKKEKEKTFSFPQLSKAFWSFFTTMHAREQASH